MKTLVLYVFHEYNTRVEQFLTQAIFQDPAVEFLLVYNNDAAKLYIEFDSQTNTLRIQSPATPSFSLPSYVKFFHRQNIGLDFGAWSDALLQQDLYKNYDNYVFVNSSVVGPFLPKNSTIRWTDIYLQGLTSTVKLFGSTINSCDDPDNYSHIQSYAFAMEKPTLEYLIECGIFSNTDYISDKHNAVWQKEVAMSRKIIERGWNIGSLLPYYINFEFRPQQLPFYEQNKHALGDVMWPTYENIYWTKEELVFVKGNR
jgi:hypothetical protein